MREGDRDQERKKWGGGEERKRGRKRDIGKWGKGKKLFYIKRGN